MKSILGLLLTSALVHGAFVPPEDGPVPFRRDKLPLDADTMAAISRQLVVLASGHQADDAPDQRLKAQLLALSLALDPANSRARDLVETLADDGAAAAPADGEVDQALSRVWNVQEWLAEPEAGEHGGQLATCLGDVLAVMDPKHPRSAAHGSQEKGKWEDWVEDLAGFEDQDKEPDAPEIADSGEDAEDSGEMSEDDEEPASDHAKLVLNEATLVVPLWIGSWHGPEVNLRMTAVKMNVWQEGKEDTHSGIKLGLPGEELSRHADAMARGLEALLRGRHGDLPRGLHMNFSLPENYVYSSSRNGPSLAVPIALLADAAFTGVKPTAAVYAAFGDDGELVSPPRAWETLREIEELPACRLILPADTGKLLPALVTLDRTEVFIKHEIMVAKDFDELVAMASSEGSEKLEQVHAAFEEIREARGSRSLGGFLGFDSTRQRLGQIVSTCPGHASARMLALRGTSQWPKRLERPVYAKEIRACLLPMGAALSVDWNHQIRPSDLERAAEECRQQLEAVERYYGAVADRDQLHGAAVRTCKLLVGLASDLKRQSEGFEVHKAVRPVFAEYLQTMQLLTQAAEDGSEYPLPRKQD
ncbi:MAG: hypothetical protein MUF31_13205 [Akkermansiaceae bacterium]|jgi:hypothetical protein|nr:hypothetical protein [Akkermansiaceae bacterium]